MRMSGRLTAAGGVAVMLIGTGLVQVMPFAQAITSTGDRAIYEPLSPVRILDTRVAGQGPALGATATRSLTVSGAGGVPGDATAVVLNVTVTQPARGGYLALHPADAPRPSVSNLNFSAGQTIPNMVTVRLGTTGGDAGKVKIFNGSAGTVHVLVDVSGYYRAHDHDDRYALTGHDHDSAYAALAHDHDTAYSPLGHDHAGVYAPVAHDHDAAYAPAVGATLRTVRGDGTAADNGTALRAALAAITDASATKPYLVQLAAGTYDLGNAVLTLKPFVSVAGSGRTATLLTSSFAGPQPGGALTLANNMELSRLGFTNTHATTGSRVAVGVPSGVVTRMSDVDVHLVAPTGFAVLTTGGTLDLVNSLVRAEFTGTTLANVVFGFNAATVRVSGSDLRLTAPVNNESAVASQSGSTVTVENSSITSTGNVARTYTPPATTLNIANTKLSGTLTGAGATVCFDTYSPAFSPVTCTA